MAKAIRWQIEFASCDVSDPRQYRIDIYAEDDGSWSGITQLTAGDTPFVTQENDSDDPFEPIRSQTGTIQVCTRLSDGTQLDLADLLPSTNLSNPVIVKEQDENQQWNNVWLGFLSCDMYNQAYTDVPENISLPVISLLEAWKNAYITVNKIETVAELLSELLSIQIGNYFANTLTPEDYTIFFKYINTSIFVSVKEYQNGESTLYELQGSSAYDILSALCRFMGWTAREDKGILYLEVLQGHGPVPGTETRNMADLVWRGDNHQRSIRQGKRFGVVTAKLGAFSIKTGMDGIPFGAFNYEKYQQIGSGNTWVYFLPSSNTDAYSNIMLHFYAGSMKMGIDNDPSYPYDFSRLGTSVDVDDMITHAIPYTADYPPLAQPTQYYTVYGGACYARMQFDPATTPDTRHSNTKDGMLMAFFPGAWKANTTYTQPIFEMQSVQNLASIEDGYINITSALKLFFASAIVGGASQNDTKFMMDLQVGDKMWDSTNNNWVTASDSNRGKLLLLLDQTDGSKFQGNWDASMDIDETDGYLIRTWYMDNGVKKHVMGRVTLRIYPETQIPNLASANRQNFICNIFFEALAIDYIMARSIKLSDRSDNTYRKAINMQFKEDVEISTELASFFHNNPSPSLLYNEDGQTPMQTLPYLQSDGVTTADERPELNLLNRVQAYYEQPRTLLKLEVKHIDDKSLALLRLNGIGDGKVYAPMAEKRDWKTDKSTITCIEITQ